MENLKVIYASEENTKINQIIIINDAKGNKHFISLKCKKCNTDNLKKKVANDIEKISIKEFLKEKEVLKNNKEYGKFSGCFNGIGFSVEEQNTLLSNGKKYVGEINKKNSEYIVNPEQGKFHKGKIQGFVGNNTVNLIISSDIFGKKNIIGLYNKNQIELTVLKDLFGIHIEGKDTKIYIKKNFDLFNNPLEGKFGYDGELIPLILTYLKYSEEVKKGILYKTNH